MAKFGAELSSRTPDLYREWALALYLLRERPAHPSAAGDAGIVLMNDSKGDRWTVK
jgi:hypothetical protein